MNLQGKERIGRKAIKEKSNQLCLSLGETHNIHWKEKRMQFNSIKNICKSELKKG